MLKHASAVSPLRKLYTEQIFVLLRTKRIADTQPVNRSQH